MKKLRASPLDGFEATDNKFFSHLIRHLADLLLSHGRARARYDKPSVICIGGVYN